MIDRIRTENPKPGALAAKAIGTEGVLAHDPRIGMDLTRPQIGFGIYCCSEQSPLKWRDPLREVASELEHCVQD